MRESGQVVVFFAISCRSSSLSVDRHGSRELVRAQATPTDPGRRRGACRRTVALRLSRGRRCGQRGCRLDGAELLRRPIAGALAANDKCRLGAHPCRPEQPQLLVNAPTAAENRLPGGLHRSRLAEDRACREALLQRMDRRQSDRRQCDPSSGACSRLRRARRRSRGSNSPRPCVGGVLPLGLPDVNPDHVAAILVDMDAPNWQTTRRGRGKGFFHPVGDRRRPQRGPTDKCLREVTGSGSRQH